MSAQGTALNHPNSPRTEDVNYRGCMNANPMHMTAAQSTLDGREPSQEGPDDRVRHVSTDAYKTTHVPVFSMLLTAFGVINAQSIQKISLWSTHDTPTSAGKLHAAVAKSPIAAMRSLLASGAFANAKIGDFVPEFVDVDTEQAYRLFRWLSASPMQILAGIMYVTQPLQATLPEPCT